MLIRAPKPIPKHAPGKRCTTIGCTNPRAAGRTQCMVCFAKQDRAAKKKPGKR